MERLSILYPECRVDLTHLPKNYLEASGLEFNEAPACPEPLGPPDFSGRDARSGRIEEAESPAPVSAPQSSLPADGINLRDHLAKVEIALIVQALDQGDWIVARAASLLGLRRTTLVEKMRRYKLGSE